MKNYVFFGIALVIGLSSCEDNITVEVEKGTIQLSADAFINSKKQAQKIILKKTKQFFETVLHEPFYADSVYVTDDRGNRYVFKDEVGDGEYIWSETDSSLTSEGREYYLTIRAGDVKYSSVCQANPVAKIDSVNWEYSPPFIEGQKGTYIVEGVIKDLTGQIDYTWVRVRLNGEYDLRKGAIVIAKDNSNVGLETDGEFFIPPAAYYSPGSKMDPIGIGDTVTFETWSVSEETNLFFQEILNQNVDNVLGAIFATPTENVRTNIISNSVELSDQAIGWFSVSIIDEETIIVKEKDGEQLSFPIND